MRAGGWRSWGTALLGRAVVCAGLAVCAGCLGHASPVPVSAFRRQVLQPPEAQALGNPSEEGHTATKEANTTSGEPEGTLPKPRPVDAATPDELTLVRALELAIENNPRLQVFRARVQQARAGVEITFAEFLPAAFTRYRYVNGGPSNFTLPTQPYQPGVGAVTFTNPAKQHEQAELDLQWLVYDFGRRRGLHGRASLATDVAELQYQRAVQTAQFNVTAAYFGLLRAIALRHVAEEAVHRAELNLKDARNLLEKGLAVRNDVLRAEALLSSSRLELVSAERAVGVARATLNEAIGINVGCPTSVANLRQEPPFGLPLAAALQLAVDNRREFAAALKVIRSARLGRNVAAADFMPRVYVAGAANVTGPEDGGKTVLDGGVNIAVTLFEGGRRLGRLHQADAEVAEAIGQGQVICNTISLEVHTAWLEAQEARQRISLARATLEQAAENWNVVRDRFRKGVATPTEMADAEVIFVRAQEADRTALYEYQTSLARVAYAVGLSLEELFGTCTVSGEAGAATATSGSLTLPGRDAAGQQAATSASTAPAPVKKAK